jgi:UV excision repair protein RAD23
MKLTFRTITGANFNVEADDSTKVDELKAKVEELKGADFPKGAMKLVYKGKILDDEAKAISEYSVNESGFLVVFIQKKAEPKPAAPAPAAPAAPAAAPESTAATPAVSWQAYSCLWYPVCSRRNASMALIACLA